MTVTSGEDREAAALQSNQSNQDANQQQQVPLHVVQAMRDEIRALKEKNDAISNHFSMMQWQGQQQPVQQKANPFANADPEDSIKVKDAMNAFSEFDNRLQSELAEIRMAAKAPDYKEVINKYLPKAAQEDPELVSEIKRSSNPYWAAYKAAKASEAYQKDQSSRYNENNKSESTTKKVDNDIDKIIANSKQSGNLASVGNNATKGDNYPKYSQMSDEEFLKIKSANKFKPQKRQYEQ